VPTARVSSDFCKIRAINQTQLSDKYGMAGIRSANTA
jgi:hypothetical protein